MATNTISNIKLLHNAGIYAIIHTETQRRYVGSSVNIVKRWAAHRSQLKALKHPNRKLQNAWDKYGAEAFQFKVIQQVENLNELLICEQFFIDNSNSFYNIRLKAESNLGIKYSEEACVKISVAKKGRVHTDETKAKISAAKKGNTNRLGQKPNAETKAKMSVAKKGRIFSDETKAKMSAALKGRVLSDETKAKIAATKKKNKEARATSD